MSTDIRRYIEVYTEDTTGYICNINQLNKIGNLKIGDIIMVYEGEHHYYKIVDIIDGIFSYEIIEEAKTAKEALENPITPDFTVEKISDLPIENVNYVENSIYYGWRTGEGKVYFKMKDYTSEGIIWEEIEPNRVPSSWKTVSWTNPKGKLKFYLTTGCSWFCEKYVCRDWEHKSSNFSDRGIPSDVTNLVKQDIGENSYNVTYASLTEIRNIFNKVIYEFKNNIIKAINKENKNEINEKLDMVISLLKKETLVESGREEILDEEDTFDYVYDDDIWNPLTTNDEISRIETILDISNMWCTDNNVRIIYLIC